MNHYRAGARLERLARDVLVSWGYTVVRSAGSKGAVDLVAIGADDIRLVQVKSNQRDAPAGLKALQALSVPAGVRCEVWTRQREGWQIVAVAVLGPIAIGRAVT